MNEIINQGYQNSWIVAQALNQEVCYYQHIYAEQGNILQLNGMLWSELQNETDIKSIQTKAIEKIDQDIYLIQKLNQSLALYSASDDGPLTWSLKTNKMENILLGAKEFISDEAKFSAILQGQFPEGFGNSPTFPVFLGDFETPFGNSQCTYFSAALIELNLTLQNENIHIQDLTFDENMNWIDSSAIVHVTPIPDPLLLDQNVIDFTQNSTFSFSDPITQQGLVFVHSGYAFGGQRGEERYPEGKEWGPEDCSTWIAKISGCDYAFSTVDQLFTYRLALPQDMQGYIDPDWLDSEVATAMQEIYSPVFIEDPLQDILPGQILSFRTFESEDHQNSVGASGHTALVIGLRDNGNVVTVGYARNMPDIEGFGIYEFSWQSDEIKEVMFFNIKSPICLDDVLINDELDLFDNICLPSYTNDLPLNHELNCYTPNKIELYQHPTVDNFC